jgi:hypothetical protein
MPADPDPFPPAKKLTLKPAEFTAVNQPSEQPVPDAFEILRINREREIAAGRDQAPLPPPKRSRRTREFFTLLILGNLSALLAYWLNPGTVLFCFAGAIIFTSGLTWVMFFVVEDY